MNTKELISSNEKIRRETTKIFAEVVVDRSVVISDLEKGVYKPIINPITLIDIEKIIEEEKKYREELLKKKQS